MLAYIIDIFRFSAIFSLCFLSFILYRFEQQSFRKSLLLLLLLSIIGYLLAYWQPIQEQDLFIFPFFFAVAFPFFFWLAAKALFDDEWKWEKRYWLICLFIPIIHSILYHFIPEEHRWLKSIPYLISISFILLAFYEAYHNIETDLIERRLNTRKLFIIFASFLSLITVYFFFFQDPLILPPFLEFTQILSIFLFIFLFFKDQLTYKPLFKNNVKKVPPLRTRQNFQKDRIIQKIEKQFIQEKLFKKENLTITALSKIIGEKEYLVRRAINQKLNYSNFNQFLNHYRIEEALRLIQEIPSQKYTFQEIAFKLGYQSVATFNRAFKHKTGQTPTQYYNSHYVQN